jgi:hypothetical protein
VCGVARFPAKRDKQSGAPRASKFGQHGGWPHLGAYEDSESTVQDAKVELELTSRDTPICEPQPSDLRTICEPELNSACRGLSWGVTARRPQIRIAEPFCLGLSNHVMVSESIGAPGFEPGTSPTRTARATRLRHAPTHVEVSHTCAGGPPHARAPSRLGGLTRARTKDPQIGKPHPALATRPRHLVDRA